MLLKVAVVAASRSSSSACEDWAWRSKGDWGLRGVEGRGADLRGVKDSSLAAYHRSVTIILTAGLSLTFCLLLLMLAVMERRA